MQSSHNPCHSLSPSSLWASRASRQPRALSTTPLRLDQPLKADTELNNAPVLKHNDVRLSPVIGIVISAHRYEFEFATMLLECY